jgi:hypothetical protein
VGHALEVNMLELVCETTERLSAAGQFEGLYSTLEGLYLEMRASASLLEKALVEEQEATKRFAQNPFDVHAAAQWTDSRDLVDQLGREYARAVQDFRDSVRRHRSLLS